MAFNHTAEQYKMEDRTEDAEPSSSRTMSDSDDIYHDPTQLTIEQQQGVWVDKQGLTVIGRSKIEQELHKYEEASHAPSKWLTLAKWFVSILLSLSFTFCLVFSKTCIIYLGHVLNENITHETIFNPGIGSKSNTTPKIGTPLILAASKSDLLHADTSLAMIIIVATLPTLTTFIRALWCGGMSDGRPWPAPIAFLVGFLTSVLESIGLSVFVICVLPTTPPSVGILLMNGVFLAHAVCMLFQTMRSGARRYCLAFTLLLSVILSAAGIVLTIFCHSCPGGLRQGSAAWAIPVSLLCLSIAWCNPLQRLQLLPRMTDDFRRQVAVVTHKKFEAQADGTLRVKVSSSTSTTDFKQTNLDSLVTAFPLLSARWKNSVIQSLIKMVLVPTFCLALAHNFIKEVDLAEMAVGFTRITPEYPLFPYFVSTVICSFMGYLLGWLACTMSMERLSFALPLSISTPIAFILNLWIESCDINIFEGSSNTASCSLELKNLAFVVPSALCLYVAQLLSTGYYVFKGQSIIMEKESQLFWLPGYNGIFLEQHLLLSRKTKQTDWTQADRLNRARDTRVFICTTMYREAAHEMKQLLRSLGRINRAKQQSDRHIQAHIFFDNGVRHSKLTQFALQLVVVAGHALGLRLKECQKLETPYGLQLKWTLPTVFKGKKGMEFIIHLKDNLKVKNKKRWSQIMYMSYVLDYHIGSTPEASDDNTFILTTDADVDFTPASVEALLDLMSRDDKVGAVCARTYPRGSGPVVWFQTFDYAIGHWFQKAANDVLGSVLCCPGCFSVYRAEALRHVVPTYASNVSKASEFLTKDMGEDRWLCTLLVQSGWRLEYSAAAENYTYCPEEFDEFFKQRRRWVPSTLANLALLLQEWKTVYYFNNKISIVFLMYQAALLFSTLISPAVCMLVVSGGIYYAWGISQHISMTLQYLVCIGYVIVCLWTSPDMQLKVAKILTVLFAFVMSAVTVGTAVQIVQENQAPPNITEPTGEPGLTEVPLPVSVTTLYLAAIVIMFVVAALLHLPEAYCLVHGIWYLWCLPAGFIILLTYSVVNLTDRSWGTREEKKDPVPAGMSGFQGMIMKIKNFFGCGSEDQKGSMSTETGTDVDENNDSEEDNDINPSDNSELIPPGKKYKSRHRKTFKPDRISYRFHYMEDFSRVAEWLPGNLREQYASTFEDAGYDDTSFLVGLTDQDLQELGVKVKAHRQALLSEIMTLADPEIEPFVPDDIEEWLKVIRLQAYNNNFRKLHIVSGKQLEILKTMSRDDIKKELGIFKQGHLKRLMLAIKKLRYPTESEMQQGQVKAKLELLPTRKLPQAEMHFWDDLRNERLLPTSSAFSDDFELKDQLTDLRNSSLVVFSVANTIWIILILTLVPKSQLNVLGTNALGLTFLSVFGFMISVQFFCMIFHRLSTFIHLIARAPPRCGDPYHINWSWTDSGFGNPARLDSVRRKTNAFEESLYQKSGASDQNGDRSKSALVEGKRYSPIVEDDVTETV